MERTRVELRWFGRELIRVGTEWIREEEDGTGNEGRRTELEKD